LVTLLKRAKNERSFIRSFAKSAEKSDRSFAFFKRANEPVIAQLLFWKERKWDMSEWAIAQPCVAVFLPNSEYSHSSSQFSGSSPCLTKSQEQSTRILTQSEYSHSPPQSSGISQDFNKKSGIWYQYSYLIGNIHIHHHSLLEPHRTGKGSRMRDSEETPRTLIR